MSCFAISLSSVYLYLLVPRRYSFLSFFLLALDQSLSSVFLPFVLLSVSYHVGIRSFVPYYSRHKYNKLLHIFQCAHRYLDTQHCLYPLQPLQLSISSRLFFSSRYPWPSRSSLSWIPRVDLNMARLIQANEREQEWPIRLGLTDLPEPI